MTDVTEKVCFKCGKTKPLGEYYKHKKMADGHINKCKECTKLDVRENYKKRRKQYSEYEKARNQKKHRKAARLSYQRKRRKREKYKVHGKVGHALRAGIIKKMPCEVCGDTESQAHHDDYSKPLDVRWLCFKHHREVHGQTVVNPDWKQSA